MSEKKENKAWFEKDFVKIGHRGARGYEAENSLSSFEKAINMGVDAVEFDVRTCKTGEAVVIHDDTVDRVSDGTGTVAEKTLNEIKSFSLKNGEKIPTLDEVLNFLDAKVAVNIEIKDALAVAPTITAVKKNLESGMWTDNMFLISSFDLNCLLPLKKEIPIVKIGARAEKLPIDYDFIVGNLGAFSIGFSSEIVDEKTIKEARDRGLKIFVFTVNEREEIDKMKKLKVDGIFSDFPDRLV